MTEEKYDPKLKEAMAKIKVILKEYDIGASISLVSKTHGEFLYHMPTWSAAQIQSNQLRVKSKKKDYASVEEQHEVAELTAHLILSLRDMAVNDLRVMGGIAEILNEKWDIDHVPFADFTPHEEH